MSSLVPQPSDSEPRKSSSTVDGHTSSVPAGSSVSAQLRGAADGVSNGRAHLPTIVSVGLAVLVFFVALQLHRPHYFLWDDNASFYLPCYVYDFESLTDRGGLAQIDPHQYLGYTYLASGQTGVLYPPVYLAMALAEQIGGDPRHGIDILAVLHFVAAAWGMLFLLVRFGVDRRTAALASVWWCTLPFLVLVSRNWIFVSYTAAFLPWSLLLVDRLVERPSLGRALALASVKAIFFFQGYVQYFVLASLFEGLFLVGRWSSGLFPRTHSGGQSRAATGLDARRIVREALAFGGAGILTAILASPLLFPMLKAKSVSAYRMGSLSFEEFLSNALDPSVFFGAQLFRMDFRAIHLATGAIFYVGLPVLVALFWCLRAGKSKPAEPDRSEAPAARSQAEHADGAAKRVCFLVAFALAVLALLASTELYGIAYSVPLLSSFRWPFKFFALFLFYLSIAAAGGFAAMAVDARRWVRYLGIGILLSSIVIHGWIAAHEHWAQPFGPNRVDQEVAAIRADIDRLFPEDRGRVVSLWLSPLEPRVYRFLIFQYATLAGVHHLGGYDPLVARENLDLAVNLEYSNIFRYELDQQSLDYLGSWAVRFLVLPRRQNLSEILGGFPELRRVHADEQLEVWENARALPFAYFPGRSPRAVPPQSVHFEPDGVRIENDGRGGWLRVQMAPLEGYLVYADGEALGPPVVDPERHLLIEVPEGAREIYLRYVDVPFLAGVGLAMATLLSALALWVSTRLRSRTMGSPGPVSGTSPAFDLPTSETATDADDSSEPAGQ